MNKIKKTFSILGCLVMMFGVITSANAAAGTRYGSSKTSYFGTYYITYQAIATFDSNNVCTNGYLNKISGSCSLTQGTYYVTDEDPRVVRATGYASSPNNYNKYIYADVANK